MSSPEQIQQQIERTRASLSSDVDRLSEKVSPKKVVGRRVDRVKGSARSAKEMVMGVSDSAGGAASNAGSSVASAASSAASSAGDAMSGAASSVAGSVKSTASSAGEFVGNA